MPTSMRCRSVDTSALHGPRIPLPRTSFIKSIFEIFKSAESEKENGKMWADVTDFWVERQSVTLFFTFLSSLDLYYASNFEVADSLRTCSSTLSCFVSKGFSCGLSSKNCKKYSEDFAGGCLRLFSHNFSLGSSYGGLLVPEYNKTTNQKKSRFTDQTSGPRFLPGKLGLLKSFCDYSHWKYAVFWKLSHHSPMTLTWEDGYFDYQKTNEAEESIWSNVDPKGTDAVSGSVQLLMTEMSHLKYTLGEGFVGKIALSGDHSWLFCEDVFTSKSNINLIPECSFEWLLQLASGIKTVVLVPVLPQGVLQFVHMKWLQKIWHLLPISGRNLIPFTV
ncbi:hypothetical protein L6164_000533 [Bauhinia variegata]|uniref:Uncharacterized protein n=1 Tax=Bauhinia variegata TaxID=167791 RepID=A0ACB9Q884_BAUVA|nr:hypothetical protein L6164_000533 [Bauhinia variegata]